MGKGAGGEKIEQVEGKGVEWKTMRRKTEL